MRRKPGKPKCVSYELIARDSVQHYAMYALLDDLIWLSRDRQGWLEREKNRLMREPARPIYLDGK